MIVNEITVRMLELLLRILVARVECDFPGSYLSCACTVPAQTPVSRKGTLLPELDPPYKQFVNDDTKNTETLFSTINHQKLYVGTYFLLEWIENNVLYSSKPF